MRALDATPASAAALGLAAFEPSFTQEPRFTGGPKTFYGMLLVVSLVMVMVLAVGLTIKQARARHLWLATATADAHAQSSFAEPGAGVGGAAEDGQELSLFRVSGMRDGGNGAGLPESGLMEARDESPAAGGGRGDRPAPEPGQGRAGARGERIEAGASEPAERAPGVGETEAAVRAERGDRPEAEPRAVEREREPE